MEFRKPPRTHLPLTNPEYSVLILGLDNAGKTVSTPSAPALAEFLRRAKTNTDVS